MIFAINNCEEYEENQQIYFVEAPANFEDWFNNQLVPWQEAVLAKDDDKAWFSSAHKIICVAPEARFHPDREPYTAAEYIAKNGFLPDLAQQITGLPLVPYVEDALYSSGSAC